MEADSTTIEQDSDSSESHKRDRETMFFDELSRNCSFFRDTISPLLKSGHEGELLEWMKEFNLIPSSAKCSKKQSGCSMNWVPSRVVDKYQWQCNGCNQKTQIRENSFFKNIHCSLSTTLKIILAWCQDVDFEILSNTLDVKKQIISGFYDKLERTVYNRPNDKLGGPGSVILVQLFPEFIDELYPVSSKSDSTPKSHHKILCLADTKAVPTRYWLHVITGSYTIPNENNNSTVKKLNLSEEVSLVLKNKTAPGGFFAIGGSASLASVLDSLKTSDKYQGVTSMNNLTSQASTDMQSFLINNIWKPVITLCEAAHDLPKSKMQMYLSCALWRWEVEALDPFLSVVRLIMKQDYTLPLNKNTKLPFMDVNSKSES